MRAGAGSLAVSQLAMKAAEEIAQGRPLLPLISSYGIDKAVVDASLKWGVGVGEIYAAMACLYWQRGDSGTV